MRVTATKSSKDHLCRYCSLDFPACPKATHLVFGNGIGNDNVIECSEFIPLSWHNNYPIEGKPEYGIFKRVEGFTSANEKLFNKKEL